MKYITIFLLAIISFYACDDPYADETYQIYDVSPVSTYLETRSDEFSEWIEILKYGDLFNAVNQATETFTVLVPDNEAVQAFYKRKGVTSIQELGPEYARDLARYHIIGDSIALEEFIAGGKIEERTLSDDFLTVTFDTSDGEGGYNSVYINKEARVTELATKVSNGYIYVLDAVLSPLIESVYERMEESENYLLFIEALNATSWSDSLKVIYEDIKQPDGSLLRQKRDYTVLAVTDDVFKNEGINSLTDLANKLGAGNDYTNPENELFLYMGYHIMKGGYSLFDLYNFRENSKKKIWNTMADAVVETSEEADGVRYINYGGGEEVMAQFIEDTSDIQAKNGIIHQIDGYLPIWQSEIPVTVQFDFCNYPEVASYIASNGTEGQVYQTEHASNEYRTAITGLSCYKVEILSTPKTPTSKYNYVDYFTVKAGNNWKNCLYKDQLILNIGYLGSIEMQTPILIAGKYKVTLHFAYATSMNFMRTMSSGSNGGGMRFSFDGENVKDVYPYASVPENKLNVYEHVVYDELEFTKTGSHTFKIVVTDPAASTNENFRIQLDYLLFEPINE